MITMRHSTPKTIPETWDNFYSSERQRDSMCQPMFGDFQLIGDSLLVRFANQILYNHHEFPFGSRTIDYCINGQRIDQLRLRIQLKAFPLSRKVMVLIGTNDILSYGNIHTMTEHFNSLLTLLKESTDKILILTLPPIPKFCVTFYHWNLIRQYNEFLKGLSDGRRVIVADICPLFTKFAPALEYEISITGEPQIHGGQQGRKRKSWPSRRKTKHVHNRRSLSNEFRSDESDYRNSTDTNTSVDSEVLSSEVSQQDRENIKSTVAGEKAVKSGQKRVLESQGRFVVRTLQSVFGKEVLRRKKTEKPETPSSAEKRPRKSPMDLNDNLCATDNWIIESGEDSMSEHVYKSQEETEYDITDVSSRTSEKGSEFSRFVESLNDTPKRSISHRRSKRVWNEKPEDTESSSSSCFETQKRQMNQYIDPNFQYFLEKCSTDLNDGFPCNSPATPPICLSWNRMRRFHDSRNLKKMDGLTKKEKLLMNLSSKICHLEFYELFYSSRKKRIDMIHLNYKGLNVIKNYLVSNNYITM